MFVNRFWGGPVTRYVTLPGVELNDSPMVSNKSTPGTKPNHLLLVTFLAKSWFQPLCFCLCPIHKSLKVSVLVFSCWWFNGTENPALSDPWKMPSVNKHHKNTMKSNLLRNVWVSLFRLTFQTKSPSKKHRSNFQQIKRAGLWLTLSYSLCSHVWKVTPTLLRGFSTTT